MVGQPADKSYGIHQHYRPAVRQLQCPRGGVQGREQLVLGQYPRICQRIQQGAFPNVGIADDSYCGHPIFFAAGPQKAAAFFQLFQLVLQRRNTPADMPPVAFQFGFPRTSGANSAAQPGKSSSHTHQPGKPVPQLRQFYLEFSFAGDRALSKNI